MSDFVPVPVPAHLVTDVMAYIARRTSGQQAERTDEELMVSNRYGRFPDWPVERLRQVLLSAEAGPRAMADVLDALGPQPEEKVALSRLAAATGRKPDSIKSSLAAFTKWVKRELNDGTEPRNWPVNYQALPGEHVAKETHYWITAVTAERWLRLRRDG
ncbi:hypothetical protein [Couchioplanes caeruleus]|uniref:Uncharacterized protein n=2 Tax=Couchioplanes caeruleus TaxID=56438 RepID=A0A1K0GBD3_9ACTN|nr:hypothetical protein [Couchioplanes caeruleus]OJF14554.1 hypothetical protein BG844_09495 [Couchioplanes caeruleus subsp. caeruleus]ROP21285.1 hypothetical protein EDD30_7683 [Couchioplanes caeruleus]